MRYQIKVVLHPAQTQFPVQLFSEGLRPPGRAPEGSQMGPANISAYFEHGQLPCPETQEGVHPLLPSPGEPGYSAK